MFKRTNLVDDRIRGTLQKLRISRFQLVGELIAQTLDGLAANGEAGNASVEETVRGRVSQLTQRFPIY